jgi:hypothetical protein
MGDSRSAQDEMCLGFGAWGFLLLEDVYGFDHQKGFKTRCGRAELKGWTPYVVALELLSQGGSLKDRCEQYWERHNKPDGTVPSTFFLQTVGEGALLTFHLLKRVGKGRSPALTFFLRAGSRAKKIPGVIVRRRRWRLKG